MPLASVPGLVAARLALVGLFAAALLALALTSAPSKSVTSATEAEALDAYGKLPLSFIPNRGQTDKRVRYSAHVPGLGIYLTDDKAVMSLTKGDRGTALEMRFIGANPDARLEPGRRAPGTVNYLNGAEDQATIPTYGQVTYRELWPGIDMVFRGQGGKLKYEFHVAPGADPSRIRLAYAGAEGLSLGAAGNMLISTPLGTLRDSRPGSYQRLGGERVPVASRYTLQGTNAYGFALGAHDARRALVIDPGLEYSTYLGTPAYEVAVGIAVDAAGSAYVTGTTNSPNFPTTPGAFDTTLTYHGYEAFVTKLSPSGSALAYSTYLGGNDVDLGEGIAVDTGGAAYVTGSTTSSDFPTTVGAPDTTPNGASDAFLTKLSPNGSALEYSTVLGGAADDAGSAVAVDGSGNAFLTGNTQSTEFPATAGAFDASYNGDAASSFVGDNFVTKVNATGSALAYSTFLGGTDGEAAEGIAIDTSGNAHITGITNSVDFPTTPGALHPTPPESETAQTAFVTKLNPAGSALAYSTFLDSAFSYGIALDASGNAYLTGSAVTKLNSTGSAIVYTKDLPGKVSGIDVDGSGSAYVTGYTPSTEFPTTSGAFDTTQNSYDAFVTKLDPTGSTVAYSTFLGGSQFEDGTGIALDASGKVYVTGTTYSRDFPTTRQAFMPSHNMGCCNYGQVYVTKLDPKPEGYARPKGASPFLTYLVPAYQQCTGANHTHGAPLSSPSCSPPTQVSDELSLGTPDANGKPVKGTGSVEFKTLAGNPGTQADEADVQITLGLTDVYDQGTLADYTGELRIRTGLRITDKLNNPGDNATVSDTSLAATVPCTATADTTQGASCNLLTSVDALVPGFVVEGKRSNWELGQVQVDDGGADGDAETAGDNTLFMVQGVFVP